MKSLLSFLLLGLAVLALTSCVILTPADYARIGEIVNEAIRNAKPSGK